MKRLKTIITATLVAIMTIMTAIGATAAEYKRQITVAQDGTGDYTTLTEAMEGIRAFMDYKVTVNIKPGTYREKVIIPAWLENVEFVGEDPATTVITWADHANINKMGTFRTYTVRVDGTDITMRNLTIENNAEQLGQAVALHTEGDRLNFINCRFLGNQDTIYTGGKRTRLNFSGCYIEGTTDFIFGPATAMFTGCEIKSKRNSYITAASTPEDVETGYVFIDCDLTAADGVDKCYLGRPWRPYAMTAFINCRMGGHITAVGWDNWRNPDNEKTARYSEHGSTGPGANPDGRAAWSVRLTNAEADALMDPARVFTISDSWTPAK